MSVADLDRLVDLVADLSRIACATLVLLLLVAPSLFVRAFGPFFDELGRAWARSDDKIAPDDTDPPRNPPPV